MRTIKINGQEFTYQELAQKLGIQNEKVQIELRQPIPAGVLTCTLSDTDFDDNPYASLDMEMLTDQSVMPLALVDQPCDAAEKPKVFLYGNGDSYIAYRTLPITEEEMDQPSSLVIGGDPNDILEVWEENQHFAMKGDVQV